jgi:hypothetical protein
VGSGSIFPNLAAVIRLVGAVLLEVRDDWQNHRPPLPLGLGRLDAPDRPAPTPGGHHRRAPRTPGGLTSGSTTLRVELTSTTQRDAALPPAEVAKSQ